MTLSHSPSPRPWVLLAALALLASSAFSVQPDKPDLAATREYAVAAGLQNKQLYAQAARRWQKFIETYPKDPRLANAHHHLGTCQLNDQQPAEAAKTFRT